MEKSGILMQSFVKLYPDPGLEGKKKTKSWDSNLL